jgi:2-haloacid dehalogenase
MPLPSNQSRTRWHDTKPSIVVFDVNETLIDIVALEPLFERVFGDGRVLREWFGQLVLYSMTTTLSGLCHPGLSSHAPVLPRLPEG